MSVIERIRERQKSIKEAAANLSIEQIPYMKLNEFARCNIALKIYLNVLNSHIWFCSNTDMAKQIKGDDPTSVCYDASELQILTQLNPSEDFLKKIHNAKTVFNPSKLIE